MLATARKVSPLERRARAKVRVEIVQLLEDAPFFLPALAKGMRSRADALRAALDSRDWKALADVIGPEDAELLANAGVR